MSLEIEYAAKAQPGDIRLDPSVYMSGEQPLTGDQKALMMRCYQLFEFFREQLQDVHAEMREARMARQLMQEQRSQTSATMMTLNSCIDNVIADQVDNTPDAVLIPETPETAGTAEQMTDLVGFVLHKNNWSSVYGKIMEDVAVTGTGIAEIHWDNDAMYGDGMVSVSLWHPEDFYPDPMYENIQDGRAIYKATRTTVAWLNDHYPHAKGYIHPDKVRHDEEVGAYDIPAPDDGEVTLLEYWYKRYDAKKRRYRVHMAQVAGGALLHSTELGFNCDADEYREGVYAHGQYPFAVFRYREVFRRPFGTGLFRDFRSAQDAINRYSKYMDDNARESSVTRHFIRRGSGINVDDVADLSKTVIEWDGSDIREVLQSVQTTPINGQVFQMMTYLTETMKEDSGQNPFTRGETAGGVTADAAIQRILTQGSKITRWHAEAFKGVFRGAVEQILWVLSEYMDNKRSLRILGGWGRSGAMEGEVIQLIAPKAEGDAMQPPAYSVRVEVQRVNPAHTEAHNERLMRAAEIAAQTNQPIPPADLFDAMIGIRDKDRIVGLLRSAQTSAQELEQLRAQNEQLIRQLAEKEQLVAGWRTKMRGTQGGAAAVNQAKEAAMAGGVPAAV